jgi:hypothetical protein
VNDSYTSQLIVNVSQNLIGANIQCASNRGSHVGTKQITGTFQSIILRTLICGITSYTAPFPWPSPNNITLSQINSSRLTFTWNSVSPNCQAVHYEIIATNCGQCPNTTSCGVTCPVSTETNSVSCDIDTLATLQEPCAIMIQPVICGNISGNSFIFNVSGNYKYMEG